MRRLTLLLCLVPVMFLGHSGYADSPAQTAPAVPVAEAAGWVELERRGDAASLREAIMEARYAARAVADATPAHVTLNNPAQRLSATMTPEGARVHAGGASVLLRPVGVGYGDTLEAMSHVATRHEGTRVDIDRGAGVTEWFVNRSEGLEQGFTVARAPQVPRDGDQWMRVAMLAEGDVSPRVATDGQSATFVAADGVARLHYNKLKVWDATGRVLPSRMRAADGVLSLETDAAGATFPVTIDPVFTGPTYLKASNTGGGDIFGSSIAVSGDTVVVGAAYEGSNATGVNGDGANNSASTSGAAYVFVRSGTTWAQQAYLKASNTGGGPTGSTTGGDQFGYSVAVSGGTVVVGAPHEGSNATGVNGDGTNNSALESGAAYVFVRSGTTWAQQAYLKASNTGASDQFGSSVAVIGDSAVVGAPGESSNATGVNGDGTNNSAGGSGAAYVFVRSGTTWAQQAYLKASNTAAGNDFGGDVAVSGDTVVVGAKYEASNATGVNGDGTNNSARGSGAAYVFVRSGTTWAQQAYLKASNTGAYDFFGGSVAVSGETVVVGAELEGSSATGVNGDGTNNSARDSGAAYVFVRSGTTWAQQAYLKASNTGASDFFGRSVAVAGDTVVVGASYEASNATGVNGDGTNNSVGASGAAYVFLRSATTWAQQAYLKASNTGGYDFFGGSVAVAGDTVVVGAWGEGSSATGVNGDGTNNGAGGSGAAYVFEQVPAAIPGAPRMGIATAGNGQATVAFLPPVDTGGAPISSYIITATPVRGTSTAVVTFSCPIGSLLPSGTDQSTNPVRGPAGTLVCTVTSLANGTVYQFSVVATNAAGAGTTSSALSNTVKPAVTTVPALDPTMLYVLPSWDDLAGPAAAVQTMAARVRSEIGEGPRAKVGLSMFVSLSMSNWQVDTTSPAAMEAALAVAMGPVRTAIANANAVSGGLPIGLSIITAIRERTDNVEAAAQAEDLRNVQWYQDWTGPAEGTGIASGWMTYSSYARKMRRIKEAYVRTFGRLLAQEMALHPNVLVAVTGDGEIEMSYDRFRDNDIPSDRTKRAWADYSPFAVAEFRDWLRGEGMFAAGQPLASHVYAQASRYAGSNGLVQFNADFGTAFTTWQLKHYDWSLTDGEATGAVTGTLSPTARDGGFDAPRPDPTTILANTNVYWLLFRQFRNEMVHRYNRDFAKWITEGTTQTDPSVGGVPFDRWYSAQVPTDVLFGNPPTDLGVRHLTSGSPHWTADIAPYGGMGVTGYNVNGGGAGGNGNAGGAFDETVRHVAPLVSARSPRWAIVEWNPADPWSSAMTIYRSDNEIVRRYRPSLLMPYKINNTSQPEHQWAIFSPSKFVDGLRELMHGVTLNGVTTPGIATAGGWLTTVTWPTPGAILQPTALSINQLNATAPLPGTFTYTIRTGPTTSAVTPGTTTPAVGTHTLIAVFDPTDPDYANVTTEVTLTVLDRPTATVTPTNTRRYAATETLENGVRTALSALSPAQAVTVTFNSTGTTGWTATANRPWVALTPVNEQTQQVQGAGSGQFAIGVIAGSVPTGQSHSAVVTVTAGNSYCPVGNAACTQTGLDAVYTIAVALSLQSSITNQLPEGQVDTPGHTATGVVGAIGVTGWVVDDQGVTGVKIYRNCLPFDNPASCQLVFDDKPSRLLPTAPASTPNDRRPRNSVVFIGDAAFLAGARPDVEAAYPTLPASNRGGWGYLMLTSMLPNLATQQGYGGQGQLDLFVYASDTTGKTTLLGRAANDDTPTRITMDNAAIGKPFGALDTPGQGETVSATFANFGWALTPDRNTTSGDTGVNGDILIPTGGSGTTLFIDGGTASAFAAAVAYNQCRGTVGNPLLPGVFCNDDVSNIFGNPTPQAPLALRTANPTLFRNLDAGRAAIGAYEINTTTLTNGLHTIAWGVTDSAGRNEGIGSRFFIVLNAGTDQAARWSHASTDLSARFAETVAETASLDGHARVTPVITGRAGFNAEADWKSVHAAEGGAYQLRLAEMGRIELRFDAPVDAGYLSANGTLRPLPVGASLNGDWFGWMPPAGYLGTYDLVFVRGGERLDVSVTVAPPAPIDPDVAQIRMHLDEVKSAAAATTGRQVTVEGWAYDPQAPLGSGIGQVHVWARRLDATGLQAGQIAGEQPAVFVGAATLSVPRPDVAKAHQDAPPASGYQLTTTLAAGTYELTVYVWNERTGRWEDARSVVTIVR